MLMKVIVISVLLHVVAGFVAGLVTIATHVMKDEASFEEPPAVEEEQPPPDVKVEIKPQAAPSVQPLNNLKMRQVGNISVASVNVDLPGMSDNFTVSAGIGNIAGGGLMRGARGSIGMGMSDVSVFGLKTRAERILFVIDANRRMVTDAKGGLNSYQVIKDEITDMVGNLSAGTLFNVILHDHRRTLMFKPQLVPAGLDIHQELVTWVSKVNSNAANPGLEGVAGARNPQLQTMKDNPLHELLPWSGHSGNVAAFLTQFALEQTADAVFFITGKHRGFGNFWAKPSEKARKEFEEYRATKAYQEQLAKHDLEVVEMRKRIESELAKINADRAKKGMPPRVLAHRDGVHGNARELGLNWKTRHPGGGPREEVLDPVEVRRYFKDLVQVLYEDRAKSPPSLNVVLFLAGDEVFKPEWEKELDQYVRFFNGKDRVIRGADEIKSARSSKDTTNN
ncbi:MAG: hypothetical protein HRT56_07685 [Coraliomargarita sp.]|nr:hypothetical protein [Coraliomargarita sp.]